MVDEPAAATGTDGRVSWRDSRGRPVDDPTVLVELELRYALTDLMAGTPGRVWTVAELVRGRVHRIARGRYVAAAAIPGTTRRRMRRAVRHRGDLLARSWPRADDPGSLDP